MASFIRRPWIRKALVDGQRNLPTKPPAQIIGFEGKSFV